ncbi:MAG: desulfoferrodoxin family protein [Oscillospiraceae bacterium]
MEFKLYRCAHCGNIVFKIVDSGVPVICCGEPMGELTPNITDGAVEKHVPDVKREGDDVTIQIGSTIHPMIDTHYIQMIAAVTGDTVTIRKPKPGDAPLLKVTTTEDVTAYEYCNLHGFWTGK